MAATLVTQQREVSEGDWFYSLLRNIYDTEAFGRECWDLVVRHGQKLPTAQVLLDAATRAGVAALTCRVESTDEVVIDALRRWGFVLAETQLEYSLRLPAQAPAAGSEGSFRLAQSADATAISAIADRSLRRGPWAERFLAISGVSEEQVGRRYASWAQQLLSQHPQTAYVWQEEGRVVGFYLAAPGAGHAVAKLVLAGIEPHNPGRLGPALFSCAAHALYSAGFRIGVSAVSATNLPVLNLASYVGGLKFTGATYFFLLNCS